MVLGRQGSGKGEQCGRLAKRMNLEHVSTGDLLRSEAREGTNLGRACDPYLVRGEAVPDALVSSVVAEHLALAGSKGRGVVLDGYPRTVAQADHSAALMKPATIDLAIHLDVPRSEAVERVENRRVCTSCHTCGATPRCAVCGGLAARRADDWPAALGRRMRDYEREVILLLEWFEARGLLETADGMGRPEAVEARIATKVGRRMGAGDGLRPRLVAPTAPSPR